jgi:hypothetical protein
MGTPALKDTGPFRGHSPDQERPLGGYAVLTGTFFAAWVSFVAWFTKSGRKLPNRIDGKDLALVVIATHKLSRLIAKDRITSTFRAPFTRFQDDGGPGEVEEAARGRGLRRAIGELLVCPFCLGMWIASVFTAGLLAAPRATRWAGFVITAETGADVLHIAYKKAEESL